MTTKVLFANECSLCKKSCVNSLYMDKTIHLYPIFTQGILTIKIVFNKTNNRYKLKFEGFPVASKSLCKQWQFCSFECASKTIQRFKKYFTIIRFNDLLKIESEIWEYLIYGALPDRAIAEEFKEIFYRKIETGLKIMLPHIKNKNCLNSHYFYIKTNQYDGVLGNFICTFNEMKRKILFPKPLSANAPTWMGSTS